MIDEILEYVGRCFDEEGYIPDYDEIDSAVGYLLNDEQIDQLEETVIRFMDIHDLTDIDVRFEKEKTFKEKLAELEQMRVENKREVS